MAIGTVVGITASSNDSDATTNTITYSLFDNDGGNFTIDANTGVVTTAAALNRETLGASRNITVRATPPTVRRLILSSRSISTILMNSTWERSPITMRRPIRLQRTPLTEPREYHLTRQRRDATTNTITYSLDDNAGGRFTIDANTGVVTVSTEVSSTTKRPRRTVLPSERPQPMLPSRLSRLQSISPTSTKARSELSRQRRRRTMFSRMPATLPLGSPA